MSNNYSEFIEDDSIRNSKSSEHSELLMSQKMRSEWVWTACAVLSFDSSYFVFVFWFEAICSCVASLCECVLSEFLKPPKFVDSTTHLTHWSCFIISSHALVCFFGCSSKGIGITWGCSNFRDTCIECRLIDWITLFAASAEPPTVLRPRESYRTSICQIVRAVTMNHRIRSTMSATRWPHRSFSTMANARLTLCWCGKRATTNKRKNFELLNGRYSKKI